MFLLREIREDIAIMIDLAIELVKALGVFGGLASSAFLIWDRAVRDRPKIGLHVTPGQVYLRIKNTMDEDLIVDGVESTPQYLSPALDHELESIVRAAAGEFGVLTIEPLGEAKLPLVVHVRSDGHERAPVKIAASWRSTRRPWPWKRTAVVETSVAELRALESARRPTKRAA
jgi:hypothetical protein